MDPKDQAAQGQQAQDPPGGATSPAPAPPQATPPPSGQPAPAQGQQQDTGAAAPVAPAAPTLAGVAEHLRTLGLNVPDGMDQAEVLRRLAVAANQAQDLYHQSQQYQQQIEQLRAQAGLAAQPQAPAQPDKPKPWWQAPEYDPAWEQEVLSRDANGVTTLRDGADPVILQKYRNWLSHQQKVARQLALNPEDILNPWEEQRWSARKGEIEQLLEQKISQFQQQRDAEQFVAQNQSWLYTTDPLTGQMRLSPDGELFSRTAQALESTNLPHTAKQYLANQAVRVAQLERVLGMVNQQNPNLIQQLLGGKPAAPAPPPALPTPVDRQANNLNTLRQANPGLGRHPEPGGALNNDGAVTPGMNIRDIFRQELQKSGKTLKQFEEDYLHRR